MTESKGNSGPLRPCPATPNCVCSEAAGTSDAGHTVDPLRFSGPAEEAWAAAIDAVSALPRARIVASDDVRLHAELRSRIFRFVDDLELRLAPEEGCIHVRSASRLGRGDLGVNRRRVEELRAALERLLEARADLERNLDAQGLVDTALLALAHAGPGARA